MTNLAKSPWFELIHDICDRGDPLLHLNLKNINFEETEYYKYDGREYKKRKKQEEQNKVSAFQSVYSILQW